MIFYEFIASAVGEQIAHALPPMRLNERGGAGGKWGRGNCPLQKETEGSDWKQARKVRCASWQSVECVVDAVVVVAAASSALVTVVVSAF